MFLDPQTIRSTGKVLVHAVMSGYRLSWYLYGGDLIGGWGWEGSRLYFGNTPVRHLLYMPVRRSHFTYRNSTANQLPRCYLRV